MARVRFASEGTDVCPICYLANATRGDPIDGVAAGVALGAASALMAESTLERGELMAQACPPHQQRVAQFIHGFAQIAGADFMTIMAELGARKAEPAEGTLIHLAHGTRTRCGKWTEEPWPDSERFVYEDKAHLVNCPQCRAQQGVN